MAKESSLKSLKTGDFVVLILPRDFVGVDKFMGCGVEVVSMLIGVVPPFGRRNLSDNNTTTSISLHAHPYGLVPQDSEGDWIRVGFSSAAQKR
jgi:hypothetical protein